MSEAQQAGNNSQSSSYGKSTEKVYAVFPNESQEEYEVRMRNLAEIKKYDAIKKRQLEEKFRDREIRDQFRSRATKTLNRMVTDRWENNNDAKYYGGPN